MIVTAPLSEPQVVQSLLLGAGSLHVTCGAFGVCIALLADSFTVSYVEKGLVAMRTELGGLAARPRGATDASSKASSRPSPRSSPHNSVPSSPRPSPQSSRQPQNLWPSPMPSPVSSQQKSSQPQPKGWVGVVADSPAGSTS